ncbi:tetratricopeptide repeat protein [Gilvibacter sp.]|uniref:tetratricopeptide repeat protein n=1 Tax=Gilvibacter sp. TaxID=2729997 RepID=UPI003F4A0C12
MRTRLLTVLLIAGTVSTFAQKKELRAIGKALKGNNFTEAKSLINGMSGLLEAASDEQKATYYLYKAKALSMNGETTNSADMLEAAKAIKMAKEIDAENPDVINLGNTLRTAVVNSAVADQNAKNYEAAASKLEAMYRVNPQDTSFLYFAASNLVTAKMYDKAIEHYKELQSVGYTGIIEKYVATDKETGEVKEFNSTNERELYVKSGDFIKPETVKTESKATEITKNIALIYVSLGRNEEAIAAMKEARALAPDDMGLLMTEADVQYKMGNLERFKELMNEAAEKEPNNPQTQFNLGVVAAKAGDTESAKAYYMKALEIDPSFADANLNMASLIIAQEGAIVEEMNNLGTSAADNRRYDELKAQRENVYREAAPYFEKANEARENVEIVRTLMNIYSILGDTEKFKAKKARLEELGG